MPDHHRLLIRVLAALSWLACGSAAVSESNPLAGPTPKPGDSVCFRRDYDAAHLRQHPAQLTTSVVLSFRNEEATGHPNVRIVMRQKNRQAPLYIVAHCIWRPSVNRDIKNKPIIKGVRSKAGFDCIPATEKDSEEGGYFVIEAADAKSLLLHLDEYEAAWPDTDLAKEPDSAKFGAEDRVFRLDRTNGDACRAIEKDLIVKWAREEK